MQIPFIGVCLYLMLYKSGLATIGVCVFDASASVGAFFIIYLREVFSMKKKLVSMVLCLVMFLSLSTVTFANENITVKLNGEALEFDVQPQLIGGRTMVPLRKIFESLGAVVTWDESTSTVTAYNEFYIVKATIGSNTMFVNGEEKWIDVPPMEVNSRTLVPARFVAEAFNCAVQWDTNTQTVYIVSGNSDYSQVEKDTSTTNNTAGNFVNSDAFNKLKNTIISKGEKEDNKYTYYFIDYEDDSSRYYSYSYKIDKGEISIFHLMEEDEGNQYSIIILLSPEYENVSALFTLTNNYEESSVFGKFSKDDKAFNIINYEGMYSEKMKQLASSLMGSVMGLMDIKLQIDTDVSFADFGMYYDNLNVE